MLVCDFFLRKVDGSRAGVTSPSAAWLKQAEHEGPEQQGSLPLCTARSAHRRLELARALRNGVQGGGCAVRLIPWEWFLSFACVLNGVCWVSACALCPEAPAGVTKMKSAILHLFLLCCSVFAPGKHWFPQREPSGAACLVRFTAFTARISSRIILFRGRKR